MAGVLKHVFASAKPDGSDATKIRASNWNDFHVFSGGATGEFVIRDTTDAIYGSSWSSGLTFLSKSLQNAQGAITADAPAVSSTATWNAVGVTFTHWKANITDTASASASLLVDLQRNGISQFNIGKVGDLTIAAGGIYRINGRLRFGDGGSDGVALLQNAGGTDFVRLQFGGMTASFPALKRNGSNIELRLADDSGGASCIAKGISLIVGVGPTSEHVLFGEIVDPLAPAVNQAALYARDNGAGKTQLVVRFNTGVVQVIATEP